MWCVFDAFSMMFVVLLYSRWSRYFLLLLFVFFLSIKKTMMSSTNVIASYFDEKRSLLFLVCAVPFYPIVCIAFFFFFFFVLACVRLKIVFLLSLLLLCYPWCPLLAIYVGVFVRLIEKNVSRCQRVIHIRQIIVDGSIFRFGRTCE